MHIIIFNIYLLQVDFCEGGLPEQEHLRNQREEEEGDEDAMNEYGNEDVIKKSVTIRVNVDQEQACGFSDDSGVVAEIGKYNSSF